MDVGELLVELYGRIDGHVHEVVRGLGGYGELVTDASDLRHALDRALKSGLPSLVNVHIADRSEVAELGFTPRISSNYDQ